ncbi:hypothetical protein [Anabaena sp. PCC 7108]|uniref:hypothetical protein n=1 Tax=Anabaena sp. PCC 7108 TaxID=163908 RepID=UPI000344EFD5|nr:hypothetical protein [Anabaena sp. PCC 7108]
MLKKFIGFFATILSFVMLFGGVNVALADTTPIPSATPDAISAPPSNATKTTLGITTIYSTPEQQKKGVTVYEETLKYGIAVPFQLPPGFRIPANKKVFDTLVVPKLVDVLGDGSVTKAAFDFQAAAAATSGNQLFNIDAPLGQKLYSVVAGKPSQQCPLQIEDTQISFFTDVNKASAQAKTLDTQGYFIYVSPVRQLRRKVLDALYDQYKDGNKNETCFLVNGATEKITVNFQDIFTLLPPNLQQPARETPFIFYPKFGKNLYILNARQSA